MKVHDAIKWEYCNLKGADLGEANLKGADLSKCYAGFGVKAKKVITPKDGEREYTHNGDTIVFYKKKGDIKYSFRIKDNDKLTEYLLACVETKRVKPEAVHYAATGIFETLKQIKQMVKL